MKSGSLILTLLFLLTSSLSLADEIVEVGRFSAGDLQGWDIKEFNGITDYSLAESGGRQALMSISSSAASGLVKKMKIDLAKTPYINWSWRVENVMKGLDETSKAGDDYPARVYVIFSDGLLVWKTKALNYVWSNSQPVGTIWPSVYTKNSMKLAVQSGEKELGKWISEKRNIVEDFRMLFDKEPPENIDAVAIMSDTDNSGGKAKAYFGDIFFSSR